MLKHLYIKNYALIDELNLSLHNGLNVITGETGTGKSIILGGLGLILGNRADTSSLLSPQEKCVIEGTFNIKNLRLNEFFQQNELDYDDECLLRREISPSGKSRAFINDTPVNLKQIRELGSGLVDIHSQHQSQMLSQPTFQRNLLDFFVLKEELILNYKKHFETFKKTDKEYSNLLAKEHELKRDLDYNQFQLSEINELQMEDASVQELQEELKLLENAEKIQTQLQEANFILYEKQGSVQEQLGEAVSLISGLSSISEQLNEFNERLKSLEIELKDVSHDAQNLLSEIVFDEARLDEINLNLQNLNKLLQKHQLSDYSELMEYKAELERNIESAENLDAELKQLKVKREEALKQVQDTGLEIADLRKSNAEKVAGKIAEVLKPLGMPDASLEFKITTDESNPHSHGLDEVELLFTANKGKAPAPVAEVASGGERSRLMLAFKYILADVMKIPTFIFDEIDVGTSGEVAIKMGKMIAEMGKKYQIINITHLPQIASLGKRHFKVFKDSSGNLTTSHIKNLNQNERVTELAEMIGGLQPSVTAINTAKELLKHQSTN